MTTIAPPIIRSILDLPDEPVAIWATDARATERVASLQNDAVLQSEAHL